jgi:hypothetical protein
MNKIIRTSIFVLLICLSSCTNPNAQTEKNIKMYTDTWDGIINKRQIELISADNFSPEIIMHSSPENIVGLENFKAYYQNFLTGFSNIEFTMVDVFGQGDKIVKHWNFKGTHSGDFFGIPATGKSVNIDGTTLVKMKDGKIAEEQDFMDNMAFMQQLGLVSDPGNVAVVDGMYQSFAKGDVPSVVAAMDANIVWNEAEGNAYADGNPYKGPDAVVKGVFGRLGAEWDGFKLVDINLHEMSNNQVLATLRYNGTFKKTGKKIDAQVAHLWTLNNGKAVSFQQYVDTKQLAEAAK